MSVAIVLLFTTVLLAATGQTSLDTYYSIYIIEALIITELFVYFNKKSRRALIVVSSLLFGGFIIILGFQVVKSLALF